ncbi:hypothetical protein [Mycobacteroides abscessus]|uniref:hypothetical protein n=1 Tax=Mycobacteroides abscessus TaxID=36809 RepID=UPI002105F6DA|nr:hypothetical protein [Mycobacteroides abscessus]
MSNHIDTKEYFGNTPAFGGWMEKLLSAAGVSAERFETEFDGPPVQTQRQLHSGGRIGVDTEILRKYKTGFGRVFPDRSVKSLIDALALAHDEHALQRARAALPGTLTADEAGQLLLGVELCPQDAESSGREPAPVRALYGQEVVVSQELGHALAGDDIAAFPAVVDHLRRRFSGLTLVPSSHAVNFGALKPAGSRQPRSVGYTGTGAALVPFDPLAAVTNLDSAIKRAAALGAEPADVVPLGWAILQAVVDSVHLARAASTPVGRWAAITGIGPRKPVALESVEAPSVQLLQLVTEKYLRVWADAHTAASWRVLVKLDYVTGDDPVPQSAILQPGRTTHPDDDHSDSLAQAHDVWFFNDQLFGALPAVVAAQHVRSVTVTSNRFAINTASAVPLRSFQWMPLAAGSGVGLLLGADRRWRAVLMHL